MIEIKIKEKTLQKAVDEGFDAFVGVFVSAIKNALGGPLCAGNLGELNADQITLLAWDILHEEVMDGGLVQLIHNGYGAFIYKNPTDRAFRNWGIDDLYQWIKRSHKLYVKYHEEIERDCNDEEFMALFEKFPEFDAFDDTFVEREESWTEEIARYIDGHIEPGEGEVKGRSPFALIVESEETGSEIQDE